MDEERIEYETLKLKYIYFRIHEHKLLAESQKNLGPPPKDVLLRDLRGVKSALSEREVVKGGEREKEEREKEEREHARERAVYVYI